MFDDELFALEPKKMTREQLEERVSIRLLQLERFSHNNVVVEMAENDLGVLRREVIRRLKLSKSNHRRSCRLPYLRLI